MGRDGSEDLSRDPFRGDSKGGERRPEPRHEAVWSTQVVIGVLRDACLLEDG